MKKSLFYSVIGGIAVGLFFGGFFTYGFLNQSNDSFSQSLAIGGYGVIKGYHADGTIFYEWEGHNALWPEAKSTISACLSGLESNPSNFVCTNLTNYMLLTHFDGSSEDWTSDTDYHFSQKLIPQDCVPSQFSCTGWEVKETFDFTNLSCTPGLDCPVFNRVVTGGSYTLFNMLDVSSQEISPGDIIVVTIQFTPS